MTEPTLPEFSRLFSLNTVGLTPAHFSIKANTQECMDLAKRFDLKEAISLEVEFHITTGHRQGQYHVKGTGRGEVVYNSSLENKRSSVSFAFQTQLVEGAETPLKEGDLSFIEGDMDIDFYQNNRIDLGEIAAQYFFLEIDSYFLKNPIQEETSLYLK